MYCLKRSFLIIFLFVGFLTDLLAQKAEYVPGEVIIQLRNTFHPNDIISGEPKTSKITSNLQVIGRLSKKLNIWHLSFDQHAVSAEKLIAVLSNRSEEVIGVQLNYPLKLRTTTPNDPGFINQWQHLNTGQFEGIEGFDLDSDLAWDKTTGGTTVNGDDIVVAIIDSGIDLEHEDLDGNLWLNENEVPNNGIDDDRNGFTDDYQGWDTHNINDDVEDYENHGTQVAGLIGAKGNNEIGIAGINWDVKLLAIRPRFLELETFSTSEAILAFDYALENRALYNETNGERGAFIVAVNASWGGGAGLGANEQSLVCNLIDDLGKEGVLTIAAAPNENVNLDEIVDLPSKCPSEYLLTITNIGNDGNKVTKAAYGKESIDLAAFGGTSEKGTWSILPNNSYGNFGGTSAATALVSGTVALLYSAQCNSIGSLSNADPKAAALLMKQFILDGAVTNPWLTDLTILGKHLNVNNAVEQLLNNCTDCIAVTSVEIASKTDVSVQIDWKVNNTVSQVNLRWRAQNTNEWTELSDVSAPLTIEGLLGCTNYEYQIQTICGAIDLGYAPLQTFQTEGCCEPPTSFTVKDRRDALFSAEWNEIFGATFYSIRYRPVGSADWLETTSIENDFIFSNLSQCTDYEIQIAPNCGADNKGYSQSFIEGTSGCGPCFEKDYCEPLDMDASEEWIEAVKVDTFEHISGPNEGYGNFTNQFSPIKLEQGRPFNITLTPGFKGNSITEYFSIWIDWNHDGGFTSNELLYKSDSGTKEAFSTNITVPDGAILGITRLRVGMRFESHNNFCPFSSNPIFGEFEDYCVEITETTSTSIGVIDTEQNVFKVYPNPAFNEMVTVETKFSTSIKQMYLEWVNPNGSVLKQIEISNHPASITQTQNVETQQFPSGVYFVRLRSNGKKTLIRKVVLVK